MMQPMPNPATFIEIVDALPQHVGLLRSNLRKEDAQEILRFGVSIEKGLWQSYKYSNYRKSVFIDGELVAMFGVRCGFLADSGAIWLMTCHGVNKVSPLRFTRIYQEQLEKMLQIYPHLSNYVDVEHTAAIRLLDNMGFTLYDAEPYGYSGNLYRRFEIGK